MTTAARQTFGEYRVGDIKYQDINGDGIIDTQDEVAIGYTNLPEIMYGFGLGAQWKNWDINAFFRFCSYFFLSRWCIGKVRSPVVTWNDAAINKDLWGKVWMSTNLPEQNAHVTYPRLNNGSGVPALPTTTRIPPGGCAMAPFTSEKTLKSDILYPKEFVTKTFY